MTDLICPDCKAGRHHHDRFILSGADAGCPRTVIPGDVDTECACDVVVWPPSLADRLAAAQAERDALVAKAEAETMNSAHDYDRRGERLWRLAALAGHEPHEADNDATAEQVVGAALAERDALAAKVAAVEELAERMRVVAEETPDNGGGLTSPARVLAREWGKALRRALGGDS